MGRARANGGFTLLEVMVALAVLAIALAALIKGVSENAANAAYLRDKTLAQWVGMNVVTEQRLVAEWGDNGVLRGEEEMGNHTWHWNASLAETFDEDVRRLEVVVRGSEERDAAPMVRLVAFVARPPKVVP